MAACLRAVQEAWAGSMKIQGHDWRTLRSLQLLTARPNFLQARLKVEKEHLNKFQTVHGGVILSLADSIGTLVLTASGLPPPTGPSVNVSTEFLRPAGREGDELIIEGHTVKLGKTLANTRIEFWDSVDLDKRKLLAFASHTKAVNVAWEAAGGKLIKYTKDGESVVV